MFWADSGHFSQPFLQSLAPTSKLVRYHARAGPQSVGDVRGPLSVDIDTLKYLGLYRRKRGQKHLDTVAYQFVEFGVTRWIGDGRIFHELISW